MAAAGAGQLEAKQIGGVEERGARLDVEPALIEEQFGHEAPPREVARSKPRIIQDNNIYFSGGQLGSAPAARPRGGMRANQPRVSRHSPSMIGLAAIGGRAARSSGSRHCCHRRVNRAT